MAGQVDAVGLVKVGEQKVMAMRAMNRQRGMIFQCLRDLLLKIFAVVWHDQKRSMSGCGNWPLCTCIAPSSAQRCRLGIALPGLKMPTGSSAALML